MRNKNLFVFSNFRSFVLKDYTDRLSVADIIYCIFKNADADCRAWIDFHFAALFFFSIARPVRVVGKVIVGFGVRHKAENPA